MPLKPKRNLIVTKPKVFVVGVQRIVAKDMAAFLRSEDFPAWKPTSDKPGEILPEVAGRLCYMSFGQGRPHDEYIANIKREGHGSVLEHATVSFILTGVSRSFTHELVRHRAGWAYSQLSQRFVDEGNAQYVMPWAVARDPGLRKTFRGLVSKADGLYRRLQEGLRDTYMGKRLAGDGNSRNFKGNTKQNKLVNGAARSVLPNATETKIFCTANARSLRHFIERRCELHADHEIRSVAYQLYLKVLPYWPDILGDYKVHLDEDGVEYLSTDYPKV